MNDIRPILKDVLSKILTANVFDASKYSADNYITAQSEQAVFTRAVVGDLVNNQVYVLIHENGRWDLETTLFLFGRNNKQKVTCVDINLYGTCIAIGDTVSGVVYVYNRLGKEWSRDIDICGDMAGFGTSVFLDPLGVTLVVGDASHNKAYIYECIEDIWHVSSILQPNEGSVAGFGTSVCISNDGNKVVVGASTSSRAYVYTKQWAEKTVLTVNDFSVIGFGTSVELSEDNKTAYIGTSIKDKTYKFPV